MRKNKWRKEVPSDARSFRRFQGNQAPASAILVVTEGEVTECVYLEEVKRRIALPTVELVSHGEGAGDPRVLAECAIRKQKERIKLAKGKKLGFGQLEKFDQLWIVFDTDVLRKEKLEGGLEFAKSNGILVAPSAPCFEFWLLLHFIRTTASFAKCANVVSKLEQEMKVGYSKNWKAARKLIPPLVDKIEKAMIHAAWVRKYHSRSGANFPANPSTEVDRLIAAIQQAASSAHRH